MNRHSHNSRGSSAYAGGRLRAGDPVPRWRTVFIALALALTIGSAGQTPPAQAAPAGELIEIEWYLHVVNPETTICVGKTVEYQVRVFFVNPLVATPNRSPERAKAGVRIDASSSDESVGNFKKDTAITGFTTEDLVTAEFSFTAKKPGKTNVYFEGLVDKKDKSSYVSFTVPVTVIRCKFKVKTVLQVPIESFDLTGISDDAVMTADEAGTFTGSATMHWVLSNYSMLAMEELGCTGSISSTDSQVDLTGQLDEDGGQFVATETIQSTMVSLIGVCPDIGAVNPLSINEVQMPWSTNPLTFRVASSGGVSTQTVRSGSARIVVVPEEDEAAAFIPGNQEARVGPPSPGWAMLWDDFSGLIGALLALH